MLSLEFEYRDLTAAIIEGDDNSVRVGGSWIKPFRSPLVRSALKRNGDFNVFLVGEDDFPVVASEDSAAFIERCRKFRAFEAMAVVLDRSGQIPALQIVHSQTGVSPLYLTVVRGRLHASWRFEDAVAPIERPAPDIEACRIFLEHGKCQVRDQVIDGVAALWPGESVKFEDGALTFRDVGPVEVVLPSTLSDAARATDHLKSLIADAMYVLPKARSPLIELSGGFDSSCVAVAARTVRSDIASYSLIHRGKIGTQQRNRRRELLELLGFTDHEHPSDQPSPFESLQDPECRTTITDDCYRKACISAAEDHPSGPFDAVITGIGGDELSGEFTFFREEFELPGIASRSSISGAVGRAEMFMRRGIWPIQPLVHPDVVDFCRAMPNGMRNGRLFNILMLARAGLSDGFLFPRYVEHYGNVLQTEGNLVDFDQMLSESLIADYKIADLGPLLNRARDETALTLSLECISRLYDASKLEAVLRTYVS